MKKAITLILVLSFIQKAFPQKWALPSSEWIISYAWLSPTYYYTLKVETDTVVDGINCKRIGSNIFSYESNDTVYFYMDRAFRSTYYFGAQIGDTISFYDINGCSFYDTIPDNDDNTIYAVVDFIDSIDVGNKFLKTFNCKITNRDSSTFYSCNSYVYTEYLGSGAVYPYFMCENVFDQESYGLCNYGDSTISDFYVFSDRACLGVGVNEKTAAEIQVYPNPFQNTITIQNTGLNNIEKIVVADILGHQLIVSEYKEIIDVYFLNNGIYFIYVAFTDGQFLKKKIFKY